MTTESSTATAAQQSTTTPARKDVSQKGAKRAPKKKKMFTPFADARRAILAFGTKHPHITAAAAAPACAAMVLLLVWFLVFSGYDAPQQFIYAGF